MSTLDWLVLCITLFGIVIYGIWKSRGAKDLETYLLANKQLPWYHVGLSVMATQASAITFLSAPGQGFNDGMRFVQFYFGLPLAMIVLCITFIPMFRKLNVYTAYEYLEKRFDTKTRLLTAALFLIQRGLSTGLTIYGPAIIISTILHTEINTTIIITGIIVIGYTVYGGTKAVSYTQMLQMGIIFAGLFLSAYLVVKMLPTEVGFMDALSIAGKMDKLKAIDTKFDWNNRYNLWSGIIGGFFLHLSYFGTDQSQVGRYLTGSSVAESRLGLVMNGLLKIPMQFLILLIGVLVFTFYQFYQAPVFFNKVETARIENSAYSAEYHALESEYKTLSSEKFVQVLQLNKALKENNESLVSQTTEQLRATEKKVNEIRKKVPELITKNDPKADANDANYIFLRFVTDHFPKGVIGLLMAVIILAAMGSTAGGLNSLGSTTVVDFYKGTFKPHETEAKYLSVSRWATAAWGIFCIGAAIFASRLGNLIEAVNILGSLFYGTILGIFLVAFYIKKINGTSVFYAAIIAEAFIVYAWIIDLTAFLWLNVLGCALVVIFSFLVQLVFDRNKPFNPELDS